MLEMDMNLGEFEEMFGRRDSIFSLVMYIQYITEMLPAAESVEEMQRRLQMVNELANEIACLEGARLIAKDLNI